MQKIKIEPFLMKKGNRVAKGAIEFSDGILEGFHLVGFTICDDAEKGLFVLFPAANTKNGDGDTRTFFFLRPSSPERLEKLETDILDAYESMTAANHPRIVEK